MFKRNSSYCVQLRPVTSQSSVQRFPATEITNASTNIVTVPLHNTTAEIGLLGDLRDFEVSVRSTGPLTPFRATDVTVLAQCNYLLRNISHAMSSPEARFGESTSFGVSWISGLTRHQSRRGKICASRPLPLRGAGGIDGTASATEGQLVAGGTSELQGDVFRAYNRTSTGWERLD